MHRSGFLGRTSAALFLILLGVAPRRHKVSKTDFSLMEKDKIQRDNCP
jgi:hypothetical protein